MGLPVLRLCGLHPMEQYAEWKINKGVGEGCIAQ